MSMGLPGIDSSLGSIYGCADDPQMCCFGLFCSCFLFGQVSPRVRSRSCQLNAPATPANPTYANANESMRLRA
jgi:Cys-rich protein (TIGR01571 family)